MEFAVRKFDLLEELGLLQGVIERKMTVPILANVRLIADGGTLRMAATDLELGLKSECPANTIAGGAVTLPAKRLFEIVRALPDKEIKFKSGQANWVAVTCGSSRFKVAGLPQEDFPVLPEPGSAAAKIPAAVLAALIARTAFAISSEDSKYSLNGALLILNRDSVTMVATDGHRLAHVSRSVPIDSVGEEIRALVPKKALAELARIISESKDVESIGFSKDDKHLFFDVGTRLLVSRMLVGQFPNYDAVLPRSNDCIFTIERSELAAAIKRVAILSDERSKAVKLTLTKGSIEVAASNSDYGEASEALAVDYAKEDLQIGFNHEYLLDFLTTSGESEISFELKDSESAAQLRTQPSTEYACRYVVMPMRV